MELPPDATPTPLKRTGRPVHPLWAHFHRGDKRNRYHYHAYCSYCVARHGEQHVPPTRGVSADMLRHLESCPNCPRKVVEAVKELCGRRERSAHAKKQAHANSNNSNNDSSTARLEQAVNEEDDDQVLLLDAVATSDAGVSAAAVAMQETHTSADDAAAVIAAAAGTEDRRKRTASEALVDAVAVEMPRLAHVESNVGGEKMESSKGGLGAGRSIGETGSGFLTMITKRGRTDSGHASEHVTDDELMMRWRTSVLQTAVAAGIPLAAFQKSELRELLRLVCPIRVEGDDTINSIGGQAFLEETAAKLAHTQLDRVKEGMLNSTIKSGLTLSVTCWRTLDLQHLVAFSLVNSNGDATCVRVEDLGGHIPQRSSSSDDNDSASPMALLRPAQLLPLARAMEDVLLELYEKNIYVMGIVADSAVALSAAKRVCRSTRWSPLLVVPCLSALLTSLAGSVLTHEEYCDAVGQMIELASYFSNSQLLASLRAMSGENDARIPLPTREHWFSFVACLTKVLHYSDAITALCTSQEEGGSALAPLALRKLVLRNNGQHWKTLRAMAALLAPLREAYSLVFQPKPKLDEINSAYDNDDECATSVHGGLTLAHVMYQLGRMSQQYAALAEASDTNIVAHKLHEDLDAMWQRYDLPTMVLAYVFDFHMDPGRLDMSNSALQWKAVATYFELYFQRWFCQAKEKQIQIASGSTPLEPVSSNKVEQILNAYQLRQFPFDADTTNDYTDVSSFYSFVSDSHPEICALCCRVYAVALACADLRHVIPGIGFLPSVAQTTERPKQAELLLHIGFATSLKKTRPTPSSSGNSVLSDLLQADHPEDLLCGQEEWEGFASNWRQLLDHELAVDELEQLQQLQGHNNVDRNQDKETKAALNSDEVHLSLDQLFFEALPPLPSAAVVAPSPHDPTGITQASVAL